MKIYEDKALIERIDRYLAEHKGQIVEDLKRIARQKSVGAPATANCPFGDDVYRCLQLGVELARERGFQADLYDGNRYALADYGEGDKLFGIFAHLDVVPEGSGWLGDPYDPMEKDGMLIGRGISDDKQAAIEGLYTMMAIRDLGLPFRSRIQLFMGGDEETGMEDAQAYVDHQPKPDYAIISDSDFPYCECETHTLRFATTTDRPLEAITEFYAGEAYNVVPDYAKAVVKADAALEADLRARAGERYEITREGDSVVLAAHGIGAHASKPDGSLSAAWLLAELLKDAKGLPDYDRETMAFLAHLLSDSEGKALGIAGTDKLGNVLHCISGIIRLKEGHLYLFYDSRATMETEKETSFEVLHKLFDPKGWVISEEYFRDGYLIPREDGRAQMLLDLYRGVTGKDHRPYKTGGATYVRKLGTDAIVFGGNNPEERFPLPAGQGFAHQANEAIWPDQILLDIKLYILAMLELDRMYHEA